MGYVRQVVFELVVCRKVPAIEHEAVFTVAQAIERDGRSLHGLEKRLESLAVLDG